jgi:hypothetical protein
MSIPIKTELRGSRERQRASKTGTTIDLPRAGRVGREGGPTMSIPIRTELRGSRERQRASKTGTTINQPRADCVGREGGPTKSIPFRAVSAAAASASEPETKLVAVAELVSATATS